MDAASQLALAPFFPAKVVQCPWWSFFFFFFILSIKGSKQQQDPVSARSEGGSDVPLYSLVTRKKQKNR